MKRTIFALSMMIWIFAVGAQAQQTSALTETGKVEQELIKIENGWGEAVLKKDIAFLDRILADDIVETDTDGNIYTKAQDLEEIKSGAYVMTSWAQDDIKVRIYGDTAVVTGRTTNKGQYKGKDISGQYRWTDTFIKRDGRWQCVATHSSRIPQK